MALQTQTLETIQINLDRIPTIKIGRMLFAKFVQDKGILLNSATFDMPLPKHHLGLITQPQPLLAQLIGSWT